MGEEFGDCAVRETFEETNLSVERTRYLTVTNDIAMGGDPSKHYVTVYVHAVVSPESDDLMNTEPEKCFGWEWVLWSDLEAMQQSAPDSLFEPVAKLTLLRNQFQL